MIRGKTFGSRAFDVINYTLLALLALACILPVIHVVAISFSSRQFVTAQLVGLWPVGFTTINYERVFADGAFLTALGVSVLRLLLGVPLQLLICVLVAYPLAQIKPFPGKTLVKWLLIAIMLFNGGLIPWFIVLKNLGLLDQIWGLVLPFAVDVFYVIIIVNYFRTTPPELVEAAEMDGATHWDILFKIYLPLAMPVLAVIILWSSVFHWNDWFNGLVLMSTPDKLPLQSVLYTMITTPDVRRLLPSGDRLRLVSEQSLRSAQIILATLPIVLVYPLLQRYFVTGLKLGGVKE